MNLPTLPLSPEARRQLVDELVDIQAIITGPQKLEQLLRQGWRGFEHFSDEELLAEAARNGVGSPLEVLPSCSASPSFGFPADFAAALSTVLTGRPS